MPRYKECWHEERKGNHDVFNFWDTSLAFTHPCLSTGWDNYRKDYIGADAMISEKQTQDDFDFWLRERNIPFVRSRMDKRPTIRKGWPDFSVFFMGRCIFIETKTAGGRLSDAQKQTIAFLRLSGNRVEVARTLAECVEAAHTILCEGKPYIGPPGGCNYPLEGCFKELRQAVENVGKEGDAKCPAIVNQESMESIGIGVILSGQSMSRPRDSNGAVKSNPEAAPVPGNGSESKFYCAKARHVGTVVVARDQEGKWAAIRAASDYDRANFPMLTDAIS